MNYIFKKYILFSAAKVEKISVREDKKFHVFLKEILWESRGKFQGIKIDLAWDRQNFPRTDGARKVESLSNKMPYSMRIFGTSVPS